MYHGAAVGVGWIVLEALGLVPTPRYSDDPLSDTVAIILFDLVILVAASLGGAAARPGRPSSSGRGRGR